MNRIAPLWYALDMSKSIGLIALTAVLSFGQVPAGTWGEIFRVTAIASAITEVLAAAAGIVILVQSRPATPV